jgi:hypothetical protein
MRSEFGTNAAKRAIGEKIAAIEGLALSPELAAMFEKFDAADKSANERIQALLGYFAANQESK